jgi:rRNA-processing protein FCF1
MKFLRNTKNGKPRRSVRNPVVRELVQKPRRNAGRHKDGRALALAEAMRLDNVKFPWYN